MVVEGEAANVDDDARIRRVAEAVLSKYGGVWHFAVRDGIFFHSEAGQGGEAWVYEVAPKKVFGFGKGEPFSQTRWRFWRTLVP